MNVKTFEPCLSGDVPSTTNECASCGKYVSSRVRVIYLGPIVEMSGKAYCCSDCLLDAYALHKSASSS